MTTNALSKHYIDDVFGPNGHLAKRFEGYTPRPGQVAFARAVDAAIRDGEHLLGECPTGTGKSIGYSVPAAYHAAHHDKRVVIVTANIALQEQLVSKDLPLLREILPWKFSYALLKGRRNYLCHSRLHDGEMRLRDPSHAEMYEEITAWADRTRTGDVSELAFEPPAALWNLFSVSGEDCKGKDCAFQSKCFSYKAKARAGNAQIIVANYHLLFLHLQLRQATGQDLVLPSFDVLICDEGHKAADIARDFFGYRITRGSILWAGRRLHRINQDALAERLGRHGFAFFGALERYADSKAYQCRLRNENPIPWTPLYDALRDTADAYRRIIDRADLDTDTRGDLRRLERRARTVAYQLREAMLLHYKSAVYFIEPLPKGGVALASKYVDVEAPLRAALFEPTDTVVITSATLTTNNGSFEYTKSELGIPEPRELVVESPFDFHAQALFIVPKAIAAPTAQEFPAAVAETVKDVIELAGGRTLALFTSYRNLNQTHEHLAGIGYRVLRQGEMPRTKLIETFRRDISSVLLGTESFWAGVDVPGEALSCVIIDRLPFASPDDPVLDAIRERDSQWFRNYSLPRAIIAFRQGFGRLIRSTRDRGVVIVLDSRLATKPYGRMFLRSIPNHPREPAARASPAVPTWRPPSVRIGSPHSSRKSATLSISSISSAPTSSCARCGSVLRGLSPFHAERTPSFVGLARYP